MIKILLIIVGVLLLLNLIFYFRVNGTLNISDGKCILRLKLTEVEIKKGKRIVIKVVDE